MSSCAYRDSQKTFSDLLARIGPRALFGSRDFVVVMQNGKDCYGVLVEKLLRSILTPTIMLLHTNTYSDWTSLEVANRTVLVGGTASLVRHVGSCGVGILSMIPSTPLIGMLRMRANSFLRSGHTVENNEVLCAPFLTTTTMMAVKEIGSIGKEPSTEVHVTCRCRKLTPLF